MRVHSLSMSVSELLEYGRTSLDFSFYITKLWTSSFMRHTYLFFDLAYCQNWFVLTAEKYSDLSLWYTITQKREVHGLFESDLLSS